LPINVPKADFPAKPTTISQANKEQQLSKAQSIKNSHAMPVLEIASKFSINAQGQV
jgi:predicted transcriptional regulator